MPGRPGVDPGSFFIVINSISGPEAQNGPELNSRLGVDPDFWVHGRAWTQIWGCLPMCRLCLPRCQHFFRTQKPYRSRFRFRFRFRFRLRFRSRSRSRLRFRFRSRFRFSFRFSVGEESLGRCWRISSLLWYRASIVASVPLPPACLLYTSPSPRDPE